MAHFLPQEEVVEAARAYEVKRLLENPRNQLWIEAMLFKSAVEPAQEVQKLVQGLGRVDVRPQGTGGLRGLPASTGSGSIDAFVFDDRWNDQRLQFLFLKNESSRMSSKSWTIWSTWTCSSTYATTWTMSSRPLFLAKHQFSIAKSQFNIFSKKYQWTCHLSTWKQPFIVERYWVFCTLKKYFCRNNDKLHVCFIIWRN